MLFLLPLQYTWAMVASYDTHGVQDIQAHFGHHEHQSSDNHSDIDDLTDNSKNDKDTQNANIHDHYGFLHMSSGEVLSHDLPFFLSAPNRFSTEYLLSYRSSPSFQPDRPNWPAAV